MEKPLNLNKLKESVIKELLPNYGDALKKLNYSAEISLIENQLSNLSINAPNENLEKYSKQKKLNYKYTSRLFKEKTGKNYRNYKLEKKVALAQKLLRETPLKITEISDRLQYSNPSAFMKMFKTEIGKTPSQYRKIHLKETNPNDKK